LSFFVGQPQLLDRRTDRGDGAVNAQTLPQFPERGVGTLSDEFGGMRRARVVGRWKLQQLADIALGSLNLMRMSKLLAT